MKDKYQNMDPLKKAQIIEKVQAARALGKNSANLNDCISRFKKKIKEGPYYVCTVCNRLLYRKTVMLLQRSRYLKSVNEMIFTDTKSYDNKEYICKTCNCKVSSRKIPLPGSM